MRKSFKKNNKKTAIKVGLIIFVLVLFINFIFFIIKKEMFNADYLNNNKLTIKNQFNISQRKKLIVIDAGHGGKDPGAIGYNNSYEKDINLTITNKVKKALQEAGYEVIAIRETDDYVDNQLRADIANQENARIFISIHCNSIENNEQVNGIQLLYYPNREGLFENENSEELANIIMNNLLNETKAKNRGVIERKDLVVLSQTTMPAIIVECGFLSNKKEEKLLNDEKYQNKIVNGIIKGIEEYME